MISRRGLYGFDIIKLMAFTELRKILICWGEILRLWHTARRYTNYSARAVAALILRIVRDSSDGLTPRFRRALRDYYSLPSDDYSRAGAESREAEADFAEIAAYGLLPLIDDKWASPQRSHWRYFDEWPTTLIARSTSLARDVLRCAALPPMPLPASCAPGDGRFSAACSARSRDVEAASRSKQADNAPRSISIL